MADRVVNRGLERSAPDRGDNRSIAPEHAWSQTPFEHRTAAGPARPGFAVSAGWDRDEAYRFVEDLFAQAPARDLRVPRAHAPGPRARRGPHPGRVRQGVSRLRLAPEARERARLAVPDRPPGRPRQPPPQAHRPLRAARRRDPQHQPVGRAPGDGRCASRASSSGRWSRSRSASARPCCWRSSTTSPASSSPRPSACRHVAARALLTRARESLRQALAVERRGHRGEPRPQPTPPASGRRRS